MGYVYDFGPDCGEVGITHLKAEAEQQRGYRQQLARHPDPRDPDYTGDPVGENEE